MSVNRSDYTLIGINIGMKVADNLFETEEFEKLRGNHKIGELAYIVDGMSGEYFIIGVPIKIDDDGFDGIGFNQFSPEDIQNSEYKEHVKAFVKERFHIDCEPKLIVVTHWH